MEILIIGIDLYKVNQKKKWDKKDYNERENIVAKL